MKLSVPKHEFFHKKFGLICALLLCSVCHIIGDDMPNYNAFFDRSSRRAVFSNQSINIPHYLNDKIDHNRFIQSNDQLGVPTVLWTKNKSIENVQLSRSAQSARNVLASDLALDYLHQYAELYRLDETDLGHVREKSVHDTGTGGIIVEFQQVVNGVEVFCSKMNFLMNRELDLLCITGCLSPHTIENSARSSANVLSQLDCAVIAFQDATTEMLHTEQLNKVDERDRYQYFDIDESSSRLISSELVTPLRLKPVFFQLPDRLIFGYYIEVHSSVIGSTESSYYSYVISSVDGQILFRNNLKAHADFSYRVWADPDASTAHLPYDGPQGHNGIPHPTGVSGDNPQATFIDQSLITLEHGPISTGDPWLAADASETIGNNVDAFVDISGNDGFDGSDFRASVTSANAFDYTYDLTVNPDANSNQQNAVVTQLFYVINFLHDWFYDHGFDEQAGNAQFDNYSRGGLGNDRIHAEAQDFSFRNNAQMFTPADGGSPIMELFIFDDPLIGSPTGLITIIDPPGIKGDYPANIPPEANFGPRIFDVTAEVVIVNDGSGTPSDACEDLLNSSEVVGKFALIDRSQDLDECIFTDKVLKAQNAGAIGVIMVNDRSTGFPPLGGGNNAITIPTMGIEQSNGILIKDAIQNGQTVEVRLFNNFTNTDRDAALDNSIIAHEWGHYLSSRLIGNGNGLGNNQGQSMGEGWGDFLALLLTVQENDLQIASNANFNGVYAPAGAYVENDYYFGLRRNPYSTNLAKNPLTFIDIASNVEVHASGEIWCSMLWECYTALLNDTRYSFDEAQLRMKNYLVASLKLTPVNPTFVEARDAFLAAAGARDSADFRLFSQAFAKRGIGLTAEAPARESTNHSGIVEDFNPVQPFSALEFVSATLDDSISSCDNDGILDVGETGLLIVRLKNIGLAFSLANTIGIVTSTDNVQLSNNGQLSFPTSVQSDFIESTIEVELISLESSITFTISYKDDVAGIPSREISIPFVINSDIMPESTNLDMVELGNAGWVVEVEDNLIVCNNNVIAVVPWEIRQNNVSGNHAWFGANSPGPSVIYLVSPTLDVSTSFSFGLSFNHYYEFETGNFDGGFIEISSDDGATWANVNQFATVGYNTTLLTTDCNPFAGGPVFGNTSSNHPNPIQESIDFGMQFQGKNVQIRFVVSNDPLATLTGWFVDNIEFTGITNFPFTGLIPESELCDQCGNVFYDDGLPAGIDDLGGGQRNNPDLMLGVLMDPADFNFDKSYLIHEICIGKYFDTSGLASQNTIVLYPDNEGVPNEGIILGSDSIQTGDAIGIQKIEFDPPLVSTGKFWILNRGAAELGVGSINLDYESSAGTHSYSSESGISGLQLQTDRNYLVHATLTPVAEASFVDIASTIEETTSIFSVNVRLSVLSGLPLDKEVQINIIVNEGSTAELDIDYSLLTTVITFPTGSIDGAFQQIQISINDDDLVEGVEVLKLSLAPISNDTLTDVFIDKDIIYTLTMDDREFAFVSFSESTRLVYESNEQVSIDLIYNTGANVVLEQPVSVDLGISSGSTAVEGVDYTLLSPLNFEFADDVSDGDTHTISIQLLTDSIVEGEKKLIFSILSVESPVIINSDGSEFKLSIFDQSTAITQDILLSPGWNHIALNVRPFNPRPEAVFQSLIDSGSLEVVVGKRQNFNPLLLSPLNTLSVLMDGFGYWVKINADNHITLSVNSVPIDVAHSVPLKVGWNNVGYILQQQGEIRTVLASLISNLKAIDLNAKIFIVRHGLTFDSDLDDSLNSLTHLQPGQGFWIKVDHEINFTFD